MKRQDDAEVDIAKSPIIEHAGLCYPLVCIKALVKAIYAMNGTKNTYESRRSYISRRRKDNEIECKAKKRN